VIVVPAIDLRDGCCVQLRGGDYADELVRLDDPVGVATRWRERGAAELHVVDLDAATGHGSNAVVAGAIAALGGVDVHVGGGLRDDGRVESVLEGGARSAVVATRAIAEPAWLEALAARHPARISLAVDVRGGFATTDGWRTTATTPAIEVVARVSALPLFQVIVTAVDVEGSAAGPDVALATAARAATPHRLAYAGGVGTARDVVDLADAGVDAVVVGTALYVGALELEGLIEELAP
jgi:phosphoribosylformimino-5-aminoimidazole carboxamide ribotide isomerase